MIKNHRGSSRLEAYAMAFSEEVSQWFQVGLKFFESDRIIAKIEYLDSAVEPTIEFDCQELLEEYPLSVASNNYNGKTIIIQFPYIWIIKPSDSIFWSSEVKKKDAQFILRKTGRIKSVSN
jgi:hypothetical protein